jgi:hypothetical protein
MASDRTMHLGRAAIYEVRGGAVKRVSADDRLRGAIESRFEPGQGLIASSQVLLAMTDDAALPVPKLIPLARSMQHCYSHRHFAPNLAAARFSAEFFRLCVATAGSTASAPSRNCRRKARFCLMPFIVMAALPRVRRMPAASRQEFPAPRLSVERWSKIGLQRVIGPAHWLTSPHQIGAPRGGDAVIEHKYFHRHVISVATFAACSADFAAARRHGT